MVPLIIGMLVCVGLALAVVALVAVPARREGRELLTPQGEEIVALVKEKAEATVEKTGDAISATVEKTGDALSTAKDKVTDTVGTAGANASPSATATAEESGRHRAG